MSKVTSIHRYRWTGEEIAVIITLGVVGIGMAIWAVFPEFSVGRTIISAFALFLSVYSYIIANGRKKKSKITALYDTETTEMMVSGHTFEGLKNMVLLNETVRLSVRAKNDEFTVRDMLIVTTEQGEDTKTLKFPLRLLSVDSFWDIFEQYAPLAKDARTREAIDFGRNSEKKKKK